ncbi:MAG: A/G-specific adenine glycosylase [Pacificimonas sp.]|jgi:A/G-specific adenine glycosylase|nr:A/G-specific adenine glycosylase [Pacificimonas sp.]
MSATDPGHIVDPRAFQDELLGWYDRHARALPWRIAPGSGERPDPYRIWLSEVMLQQTVVKAVIPYFEAFTSRWPTVEALAAAPDADILEAWAGLGYYARARNLIACARDVAALGGFPGTEAELRTLPGLGAYTAAAIAAIAFGQPATVVDGNIERVMARLFEVDTPLPAGKKILRAHAATLTPDQRPGDYAQALMDLGATVCRPKAALCLTCPVARLCKARGRDPERLPIKLPKAKKPERQGVAFWLECGGAVLLVRREDSGLLGGMRALPASGFTESGADRGDGAPVKADWQDTGHRVSHGFTHFNLTLTVLRAERPDRANLQGEWVPIAELDKAGLPTLFKKVVRAVRDSR